LLHRIKTSHFNRTGEAEAEGWYKSGVIHRGDGPADVFFSKVQGVFRLVCGQQEYVCCFLNKNLQKIRMGEIEDGIKHV